MRFEFATATRILFGPGTSSEVPALVESLGQRLFVVTDSEERCKTILDGLRLLGLEVGVFLVNEEPDINCVILATRNARESAH